MAHAAPAAVFVQFATQEDFLTPDRARRYFAKVSEPKQLKLYDAPHALNAEARRDRAAFLRTQLGLGEIDWAAMDRVPELVQPSLPRR